MITTSAPAKIILCGEHAVVYNRPAIALPLGDVRAYAVATPTAPGTGLHFVAPDLDETWSFSTHPQHPLSELAATVLEHLGAVAPDLSITLRSDIPIAGGMGSGAAIGAALVRAVAQALGHNLPPAEVSALVYASEGRYHGTPSGIDNTVIAYEQAIWFQRRPDAPPLIAPIHVATPLTLVIGDTGVRSATHRPVGALRKRWQADPPTYEARFDAVADVATQARAALAAGDLAALGQIMNTNQTLLEELGISSPELDRLVQAARQAGALGAKLSGAGWGGVMIALAHSNQCQQVADALHAAGASRVRVALVPACAGEI
ncbi:mevalonate kinase [Candidatus Oscillochloris fontis]|uniref:mevalonate kinase n=1 Tax=Candidatus Oscillochloris fontis TaxID=2496868 RepID=UPI00101CE619|nr:mevalonate kinase [Candidatus Oscillochloris fontis]